MLAGNQADGLVNTPEQVRQYGSLIQQQGERLNDMVEQALQFAGVHSRARLVRRTELDLRRVIDDALEASRSELERAGFEVETNIAADLPPVLGDAQTLRQAIENLLNNAVKYANGHCWVRLTVRPDEDRKAVSITVEDRGIGIDPADAGQIFEPFYRGSRAVSDQIPGTGLGLSLVRSTAALHRGTVTFESAPGVGSSFTLRLPAADRR
jgi:two-component system sensor histidine kinase SenX3